MNKELNIEHTHSINNINLVKNWGPNMKNRLRICIVITIMVTSLIGQTDHVKYIDRTKDPLMDQMKAFNDSLDSINDSLTSAMKDAQKKEKITHRKNKKILRFDTEGIKHPESPDDFKQLFHFPPVAQYKTGTCWSFSTTSFVESEIYRTTDKSVKLSEMHTVYYEYLAKIQRIIERHGDSFLGQGSESNAALKMIKEHGAVPFDVYPGFTRKNLHDHSFLFKELEDYMEYCRQHSRWDEGYILTHVRVILNKYLGTPPETFQWDGKNYTPQTFVNNYLEFHPDDYVSVLSTLSYPFHSFGAFEVPDNWWHDSTYYNLPLDEWYSLLKKALKSGYTMVIGGDVSEPGFYGSEDIAIIPNFDIPGNYINQDSREYRIYNQSTEDDHGIHIVGMKNIKRMDWFLIKDSSRGARKGSFEGYMFYREDYVRLKMLSFMVHKDLLKDLPTFAE